MPAWSLPLVPVAWCSAQLARALCATSLRATSLCLAALGATASTTSAASASAAGAPPPLAQTQDPDARYALLVGLAEKGLHELVVDEARAFLRESPGHPKARHARYRLGAALAELGRVEEARAALADPASDRAFEFVGEANVRLARLALAAGDAPEAERAATRAIDWGKPYAARLARALRAEARAARGAFAEARADHEAVLAGEAPAEVAFDARFGRAWCLWRGGDAAAGASAARELLARTDTPATRADAVRVLLGECELDAGRASEALAAFRAVRDDASSDAATSGAGHALVALGKPAEAAVEFARVLERTRDAALAADVALRCGLARLDAGDAARARQVLSDPRAGDGAAVRHARSRAELATGDARAALATAEAALAATTDATWRAHLETARGAALEALGRTNEAAEAYARSGSSAGLLAAANAHLVAGRHAEARRSAEAVIAARPPASEAASAWRIVGEALLASDDAATGERAFAEASRLETDPTRAAHGRLRGAWCRWLAGDARGARALADEAANGPLAPDEAEEARFLAARAAEGVGERDDAARRYAAYVDLHPRGPHALEACVRLARNVDDARALPILRGLADASVRDPWVDAATFDLAERLAARGDHAEAARRFTAVAERTSDVALAARARYGAAYADVTAGDVDGATRALEALLGSAPTFERVAALPRELQVPALDLALFAAVTARDTSRAVDAWSALVARDDGGADALSRAVDVFDLVRAERDATRRARSVAILAGRKEPAARALATLAEADARLDAGDLDACETALASPDLRERDGPWSAAQATLAFALAEARYDRGEDARALPLYDELASRAGPRAASARYKAGFARLRSGDAAGAERDFARLLADDPRGPYAVEAAFLRGEALVRLERLDEAVAVLERARDEGPSHAVASKVLYRLGVAECRRGRFEKARAALDALVAREPGFAAIADAELWRGRALAGLADTRAARAAFERVRARGPGASADAATLEIGRLDAAAGEHERALKSFLEVALLSGAAELVPEALWLAGNELEALGQPARAADRYREIVAQHGTSPRGADARARLERLERPERPERSGSPRPAGAPAPKR